MINSPQPASDPEISALLFERSPDCVKLLDLDGRVVAMNRNGQCAMEIDEFSSVSGRPWQSLWPAESQPRILAAVDAALNGAPARLEAFCPTVKGAARWWDVTVTPVPGEEGRPHSILVVSRDVTDLHDAQEEQRETAARLRFVLQAAQVGQWELDVATGQARTSLIHDRCFGYSAPAPDWSYDITIEHIHPDDRPRAVEAFDRAQRTLGGWEFESRVVWPDGSVHWIHTVGSFYQAGAGAPGRMLGAVRDITQHKHAQDRVREAGQRAAQSAEVAETERRRLDVLLEAAPVGIVYADAAGKLVRENQANRLIWGGHPLSSSVEDYSQWKGWWADGANRHGQPIQPHEWGLARALQGEEVRHDVVEIEPFDAPGSRKTVLLQARPVRGPGGQITGAVVTQIDVTGRVRAESGLRESEAKFRTIANAMPQMVWSALPDGYHDYFNQQWYGFTGAAPGLTDGDGWNRMIHPEDQERARARWRRSLETGAIYEIEYRLRHRSGEYRWVLGRALPILDASGRIVRWMGTCTDIHAQKLAHAALAESEESLRQADHRKDEFLAMLAHELRNPLAPICTAAELLRTPVKDEGHVAQASAIISRQVRHMTELVDDLLDVSRVTRGLVTLELETFDLRTVVHAATEQVQPLIDDRRHRVSIRPGMTPLWVRGDRTRLTQVIANLLNNAAKYTPPGGEIELEARAAAGDLQIRVSDNGMGIDAALLPHIFALFSQGKRAPDRAEGGLGIGLALVRSLVNLHGGQIEAESKGAARGSTFIVSLPQVQAPAAVDSQAPAARRYASSGGLRIVVVDDNVDAAESVALLLEAHGHRVSTFHSAEAALDATSDAPADAYILDIGLPGITGHELARRLRQREGERQEKVPDDIQGNGRAVILALSGYGQQRDRAASLTAGFDEHLVKPLDPMRLLDKLVRH